MISTPSHITDALRASQKQDPHKFRARKRVCYTLHVLVDTLSVEQRYEGVARDLSHVTANCFRHFSLSQKQRQKEYRNILHT